jgi:excisionase family DNA binding protein
MTAKAGVAFTSEHPYGAGVVREQRIWLLLSGCCPLLSIALSGWLRFHTDHLQHGRRWSMTTTNANIAKRAYRVSEVAEAYGIGRTKLYDLIKEGKLHTVKVGGRRLIPAESLEALLK